MKCKDHYPIMGRWRTIEDTYVLTTWECPQCGERYTSQKSHTPIDSRSDEMKEQSGKYLKSQIAPFRQGELSKEFTRLYPDQTKGMIKAGSITHEEVQKAKDVWKDLPNYSNLDRTL